MQADQQLTLDIGGNQFRITTSDPDSADFLRSALAEHVIEGDALLGFKLALSDSRRSETEETSAHRDPSGLSVLVDCTGAVLARSRHGEAVLAALTSHLAAINLSASQSPASRYRLRALIAQHHAVLVMAPLFTRPPVIERRLARLGYRVADVPFIDIDAGSRMLQPFDVNWPALAHLRPGAGHASSRELAQPVTQLLWPAQDGASVPSLAQVCHAIATSALTGSHEERLLRAEHLAKTVDLRSVKVNDVDAPYEALRGASG